MNDNLSWAALYLLSISFIDILQKQITAATFNCPMPKFFYAFQGKFYKFLGSRPTNHLNPRVLEKIADRLEKFPQNPTALFPTAFQQKFIKLIRAKEFKKISKDADIAHNIPISSFIDNIVYRLNSPMNALNPTADERFIDEMLSSDDELGKKEIKHSIRQLQEDNISNEEKLQLAENIVTRLNRSSHNLTPSYRQTNRSIGKHRDPQLLMNIDNTFSETPKSKKLGQLAQSFLHVKCEPKSRRDASGVIFNQSSSIDPNPEKSWYKP